MRIRIASEEDAGAMLALYAPYVRDTAVTFECAVPSEAEFRARVTETLRDHPWLAAEEDGVVIGYVYAHAFRTRAAYRHTAEMSVYLRQDMRGRGIGSALYAAAEQILLRQRINTLYACTTACTREDEYLTDASPRFHRAVGYTQVGRLNGCGLKFGRYYDLIIFEKTIAPKQADPGEFVPFSALRNEIVL